jgi:chemotaxis protein methyltransferase CheR
MPNPIVLPAEAGGTGKIRPETFERIRQMLYQKAGIDLRPGKEELVGSRLAKKLRETGATGYEQYLDAVLADRSGDLLTALIDVLTTNFTSFLREPAHFAFLHDQVFPRLAGRDSIHFWCAAAATGEEPYSLIFSMLEALGGLANQRCRLLATDISTQALATARKGIYSRDRLAGVPDEWLPRYFLRGDGRFQGLYQVKPDVAQRVAFAQLNLIENFSHQHKFPVIFCRNVMIYFDRPTQERVVHRLKQFLEPGGYLIVGHSESLNGMHCDLNFVQPAVYQLALAKSSLAQARLVQSPTRKTNAKWRPLP